ncbi:hypothetical protein [Citrobacter freundii]|uniref:hypothetical protein n=1 Tax=Citrobacter freundii TaxID=546 RepID=UPI0019088FFC|nr:hypothetical protein [Citrobacter freundii]MBJ8931637.1 hypothetical protein [Citrobacter freundii]
MNEIIIDKFLLVTPTEHVAFHDQVLLHIQAGYIDMARMSFNGGDFLSFRSLVNEIYLAEDTLGRGMDRIMYAKVLKFVILRTFEDRIADLEVQNKLISKMFELQITLPQSVIEHLYYVLAKISSCQAAFDKLLDEHELSLANHALNHCIDKLRRTIDNNSHDVWGRIWECSQARECYEERSLSVQTMTKFKTRRRGYV